MNKQFTASEVRGQIAWLRNVIVVGTKTTYQMLDAFADLLEAQERAVPVVTRESAINAIEHIGRYNGPGRETEARQMLVEGSPSVAHRAPSDAKRLADAVFPSHRASAPYENHPGKRIVGFVIDESHPWWGKCGLTEPLSALEAALASQENPNG